VVEQFETTNSSAVSNFVLSIPWIYYDWMAISMSGYWCYKLYDQSKYCS
jgi:hypothetical protein